MDAALAQTLFARDDDTSPTPTCEAGNKYDGRMGLRISSVFVILVGSTAGALFPVTANRLGGNTRFLWWAFFIAKFFGSGVIISTAFIHLLGHAEEALRNECLTGPITEYRWVEGIILMTIVVLFFVEMLVMRFSRFGYGEYDGDHRYSHDHQQQLANDRSATGNETKSYAPGEEHLGHKLNESNVEASTKSSNASAEKEDYTAQLTSVFILEFGIIFHSVFVGLTLAVSGAEFVTLYIVLVFHQMFEGLGLGSRLATIPWPRSKRAIPYYLAIAYGLTTPIAIAIGLGVRQSYLPEGRTTLIVNGVFDSISAGILIYTALVELMAHEFMFSSSMRKGPFRLVLSAFGFLCLGAALMALLGEWA